MTSAESKAQPRGARDYRLDDSIDLQSQPALFGSLRRPGLVSVAADRKGALTAYRRLEGEIQAEEVTFGPFLWLAELDVLRSCSIEHEVAQLEGENFYRYLVRTQNWSDLKALSDHIATVSGQYASHPESPQLYLNDPVTQYLLSTGQTFYNKMALADVRQVVIRIYTALETFADPGDDPQRITAVALRDLATGELSLLDDSDEDKLLWHLSGKIKKLDPDLLLGHNLYKRDLELISQRAKIHKVKLDWGRGGGKLSGRRARTQVAEKQLDYQRYRVDGREFADSWILAILHDVSGRELTGYDLEDVAEHFGLALGKRNASLEERADKDTAAIAALHGNLLYPYFLQSQIFPLSFENVMLRGNATRINHLFLREYYRCNHSIPTKPEVVPFAGGLTAQEHEGCAYGVYHCDVASLYPSLITAFDLGPEGDALKIFTGLLEVLRQFRLQTKARQRQAEDPSESAFFGNLQTTFKILINSFYGYLGFGQGHFADFERAAEVTRRGRELLLAMMEWLRGQEAHVLEVDTDGIYFVPSERFRDSGWLAALDAQLPTGVQVEFDGAYPGMYCHKMKNYALLEDDGTLTLRGSGLRSRALEPFLRQFIEDLIRSSLTQGPGSHQKVFADYESRLKAGLFSVEAVAKTETLIDSPYSYSKKIEKGGRNRAAVYELALTAERKYHAGESLSYYVVGDKATVTVYNHSRRVEEYNPEQPDINFKYYLKKLKQTYKNFEPVLSAPEIRCPIPYSELPRPD